MVGRSIVSHAGSREHEWLLPTHAQLDLLDTRSVRDFVGKHRPDAILHAAGRVGGIQANLAEPVSFFLDNFDMGRNVVTVAASAGVPLLLNFGSSCMYPRDRQTALREEDVLGGQLEPTNEGYALAKISVARLTEYVSRTQPQLQYKTVIPCNLFGPYDKFDPARSHMIPAILRKLHEAKLAGAPTVEVWGSGEARREFMYVKDLADAVFFALGHFDDMPQMLNIGLGQDLTVNEYYQVAAEVVGFTGMFTHDLSRPVGMLRKLTDTTKASLWGWSPRTSLRQGLELTYDYYLGTLE